MIERDIVKFDEYLEKIAEKMKAQKARGKLVVEEQARASKWTQFLTTLIHLDLMILFFFFLNF